MKTKDKIVFEARKLFNEQGFGNVSLNNLADHLGIAKGNVWYHFNDKRALLARINELYKERAYERLQMRPQPENLAESYADFIRAIADEIREFRFMFRDQADYGAHSKELTDELPKIYELNFEQVKSYFFEMRAQGLMQIADADLKDLVHNVVIVLRYNMEFVRETGAFPIGASGSVAQACLQHLSVLKPYLQGDIYDYLAREFSTA